MWNFVANYMAPLTPRSLDMCEHQMYVLRVLRMSKLHNPCFELGGHYCDTGSWHGMINGMWHTSNVV